MIQRRELEVYSKEQIYCLNHLLGRVSVTATGKQKIKVYFMDGKHINQCIETQESTRNVH